MKTGYEFFMLSAFSRRLFRPREQCSSEIAPDPLWTLIAYSFSFLFGLGVWAFVAYILIYSS